MSTYPPPATLRHPSCPRSSTATVERHPNAACTRARMLAVVARAQPSAMLRRY